MENKRKQRLMARFMAGIASEKEQNDILKLPEVEQMMNDQWAMDDFNQNNIPKPDLQGLLINIYRRIFIGNLPLSSSRVRRLPVYQRIAAFAALIILLVTFGTILWNEGVLPGSGVVTINAPVGVKAEIFLPDGSRVWLKPGSKISYNKKFESRNRELNLNGEAYFNISHNPNRPLIVKTKTANVEVLGTRFNVVSIPSEDRWEATLVSGSIRVNPSNKGSNKIISLSPGQKAVWNHQDNSFIVEIANTDVITRWVSNQLTFENETFSQIAKQLEHTFGVRIELPREISEKYRFTAKFSDESLFEIFNLLQITAPFDFSMQGNRLIVTSK